MRVSGHVSRAIATAIAVAGFTSALVLSLGFAGRAGQASAPAGPAPVFWVDPANGAECFAKGLSVIQGDADKDHAFYVDGACDDAILRQPLQTTLRTDKSM